MPNSIITATSTFDLIKNPITTELITGVEFRYWQADHFSESNDFHYAANESTTEYLIYDKSQIRYDYSSIVQNLSCYWRLNISPSEKFKIMADIQAAQYYSEVEENPIQLFDYGTGEYLDEYIYNTKDMVDADGVKMFNEEDFKRTWSFISPKFGLNYKATDKFSMFVNYSIAHKEPKVSDWYSYTYGPNQDGYLGGVQVKELKPEKVITYEFGYTFRDFDKKINLNIYRTYYLDKIGRVTMPVDGEEQTITANYGDATHQGIELSTSGKTSGFDYYASGTISRNRWNKMDVESIGSTPAEELLGNVVPYSPERMASGSLGYTFDYLANEGSLRYGMDFKWWDDYYCNMANEYDRPVEYIDENGDKYYVTETFSSELPYFLTMGANITYKCKFFNKDLMIKLDINNFNNRDENYTKGYVGADYGRNDYLLDEYNLYVVPAPLLNIATTFEIKF